MSIEKVKYAGDCLSACCDIQELSKAINASVFLLGERIETRLLQLEGKIETILKGSLVNNLNVHIHLVLVHLTGLMSTFLPLSRTLRELQKKERDLFHIYTHHLRVTFNRSLLSL